MEGIGRLESDRSVSTTCCFCTEINSGVLPQEFQSNIRISSRLISESADFAAFPTISPLRSGHILVIPKCHLTSVMHLDSKARSAFIDFTRAVSEQVSKIFGPVIYFEHGVEPGSGGGCGVDHAHWHILPCSRHEAARVFHAVKKDHQKLAWTSSSQLTDLNYSGSSYLIVGRSLNNLGFVYSKTLPSQYLRRLIAYSLGLSHWNWREVFNWDGFRETLERMPAVQGLSPSRELVQRT